MKKRRIFVTAAVKRAITEQSRYIAQFSPTNAKLWRQRARAAVLSLGEGPLLTVDEDASERFGLEIRRYVFERTHLIH